MKRVFIIHGWEGYPEEGWFPWLKRELEAKGFEVHIPTMPNSESPNKEVWIKFVADLVGSPDKDTYFVGHSIGCKAIMRYLESLSEDKKIGGVVFVACWLILTLWEGRTKEELDVIESWANPPLNFEKIKNHSDKFIAIFSDDDPYVPVGNQEAFRKGLGAEIIIEHGKSHFGGDSGIKELPIVLEKLLEISK